MVCNNCGYTTNTEGSEFCPNCGGVLVPETHQSKVKTSAKSKKRSNGTIIALTCIISVVVLLISTMLIFREPLSTLIEGIGEKTEESSSKKKDKTNKEEQEGSTNADETDTNEPTSENGENNEDDSNKTDEMGDLIVEKDEVEITKENIHLKFNEWTSVAAKGNYKFTRVCQYTPDGAIDVGDATATLDRIIKLVDSNASLDSFVGGFLGIGNREGKVQNGQIPEGMNDQYALKAMQLTAADIKSAGKDGNTYKVQINACANPKKDNSNALSRATNDFFTHEEVVSGITSLTSAIKVESTNVEYTEIVLAATVENGQMTKLEISYSFAAQMNLKAA